MDACAIVLSFQTVYLMSLKASHAVCSLKDYVSRSTPLYSIVNLSVINVSLY